MQVQYRRSAEKIPKISSVQSMVNPKIPEPNKPDPPKIPTGPHYQNPPESVNPDAAALREQWRFAVRQYSKWYSHAWGTAILAGLSFFALGWVIKGSNPLPSFKPDSSTGGKSSSPGHGDGGKAAADN